MAETTKAEIPATSIGVHKGTRVVSVPLYLAEFTDKEGIKQTKLAVIIGSDVRFFSDTTLSGPVAGWLSENILAAAGMK